MRKFYVSFLAFAAMMLVSVTASAWSFDMTDDNEVLQSEAYNYRLYKSYNFFAGQFNGENLTNEAGDRVYGDGCLTLSADKAAFKLNGFDVYRVTAPVQMQNFYLAIGTGAINLRAGVNKDGLHNYGSGSRFFAIADVKAGQIIVCQWGFSNTGKQGTTQPSDRISGASACTWDDITEEVHAAQDALAPEPEAGQDPLVVHDNFSYWRATSDGFFVIEMGRDNCIQGLQIWIDATAKEAVTSPSLKVTGVNYDSRTLEFKPGESTFGNPVVTYYSTDGSDPVFLKDSEEVDHYEDDIPVYKKVLDMDAVADAGGLFGENEPYDPEMGYIVVDANFDEDDGIKDNIVTVKAVSVSVETGVISDILTLPVSVEEITLNKPTFTLTGIDGVERTYTIGWTNNTLCGEEYQMIVETGEGGYYDLDPNTGIGTTVTSATLVKVTVKVEGYNDGSDELSVDYAGIDITRKNTPEEGETTHDWDFTALTNYQLALIKQDYSLDENIIESCYILEDPSSEESNKIYYTKEEFINGESDGGVDLSEATPVLKASGWTFDSGNYRATLNVASSEEVDPETLYDLNENGYGYVKDEAGIFDGLQVSCPPNTKNASCILQYIGKVVDAYNNDGITQLGAYFMSKPTITFPREVAKAGELVVIYYGTGGSNYTTYRTPLLSTVPEDALLTVTLPAGSHVFYIDVYTYDSLPEDSYATGIAAAKTAASAQIAAYYTFGGVRIAAPQKGFNMVKYTDGSIKKLFVK